MTISVGAAFEAELVRESGAQPVILLALDFATGMRRFAMWPADVEYASNTYFGLGPIGAGEMPEQSQDGAMTEQFLQFYVQNQPDVLADIQQNSRHQWCDGYLVFLGSNGVPVNNEAIHLWHKRMVPGKSTGDAGMYASEVALESAFHRHRMRAPRTYSHAEQQRVDATDFSFRDAGKSVDLTRKRYSQRSGLPG